MNFKSRAKTPSALLGALLLGTACSTLAPQDNVQRGDRVAWPAQSATAAPVDEDSFMTDALGGNDLQDDLRRMISAQQQSALIDADRRQADRERADARTSRIDAAFARMEVERIADLKVSKDVRKAHFGDVEPEASEFGYQRTDSGWVMTFGGSAFADGKSDLNLSAHQDLHLLFDLLAQYPNSDVSIEGHTDSVGSAIENQNLSQHRADSVRAYLIGRGVASNRLSVLGRGEKFPIGDNETSAGRQRNRRVELIMADSLSATPMKN